MLALWFGSDARSTGSHSWHGQTEVEASPNGAAVVLLTSSWDMPDLAVCLVIRLKSNLSKKKKKKKRLMSSCIQHPSEQTLASPYNFLHATIMLGGQLPRGWLDIPLLILPN